MTSVVAEVETRVRGYVERAEQLKKLLEAERPAAAAAAATCTDAAAAAKVEEEELAAEAQNLLDRGVAKISAAVEKDTAGDLRAAFNMYTMGLGFLSAFLRGESLQFAVASHRVGPRLTASLPTLWLHRHCCPFVPQTHQRAWQRSAAKCSVRWRNT